MTQITHLGQAARAAAAQFGEKQALVFDGEAFTFNQLDHLVEKVAAGLVAAGVDQGDVVTLYAGNSWQWIVSYYAIARAGAVINPINTMLTPDEVRFVVSDCRASAIIVSEDKAEAAASVLEDVKLAVVIGEGTETLTSFDSLIGGDSPALHDIEVDEDSLSTICYTSGTTGHPKGAMQSHKAVITNGAMTAQMQGRGPHDTVLSALPCPHVYANVVMQSMMLYGSTLILHDRFDPTTFLADITAYEATVIDGVPTMYMFLLNDSALSQANLSSLTRCYVGGQTMPVATMEQVEATFGVPLVELWGMTEIAGLGTTHPLNGKAVPGSIGVALPYCQVRVASPDAPDVALPEGEDGELQLRGPITMMGYFGNEEQTKATLLPNGWLRTGDIARIEEDGKVFIVDRLKDMIISGGFNIYPAEIERVLAMHPDVALAAVGKQDDEVKGEIAIAFVVPKQNAGPDKDAITAHCRDHLAAYKCPRDVVFVVDVPKTSTGKIMRRALGARYQPET
ncbi:AMP-binding protein [Ruegeria sp. SCPT10]|uniref:class I adenylate-forming enzyme family protein n=1 Tax=Ruegeria sp. SCP10 TaxID=3141377 RepID=UPI003337CD9F